MNEMRRWRLRERVSSLQQRALISHFCGLRACLGPDLAHKVLKKNFFESLKPNLKGWALPADMADRKGIPGRGTYICEEETQL